MGRNHVQCCDFCLDEAVLDVNCSGQHLVQRPLLVAVGRKVEAGCGVGLRIGVNDEHFLLKHSQRCGKVDGCSCLTYASFLICDCYYFSHVILFST